MDTFLNNLNKKVVKTGIKIMDSSQLSKRGLVLAEGLLTVAGCMLIVTTGILICFMKSSSPIIIVLEPTRNATRFKSRVTKRLGGDDGAAVEESNEYIKTIDITTDEFVSLGRGIVKDLGCPGTNA